MHFQISLSLWELQVIKDFLCIKDIAGISSNRLLLLLILKKIKFHLKPTVLKSLFFIKLHVWGSATFLWKQSTALDMVLNTYLSHKLSSTYYYNTDVCKDPNDYRTSCPEVFCKNGVLRNFAKLTGKHLYQSLFFNKVAGLRRATLFKTMTLAQVISCEFCEIF